MPATPWKVPRMWQGKTVAILATGPSLTPQQCSIVAAAGLPAIAINDSFRLAPDAAMLYAADGAWWTHHAQDALKFPGLKVTAQDSCVFRQVLLLKPTGTEGFDPDPACLRTGGNSGYQAIHIAIHAGASRILLLGFDMSAAKGAHWFGKHPAPLRNTVPSSYEAWKGRFPALAGRGAEIINCTPGSALTCYPAQALEDALAPRPVPAA